ncbi:MAG: FHA domain-containing protein [Chloroflexota bacterium]
MDDDNRETMHIRQSDIHRAIKQQKRDTHGQDTLNDDNRIVLHIMGHKETVQLDDGERVILGRFDPPEGHQLDLSPYNALLQGISREHAEIHVAARHVYLVDLGSTNGTYVAGERLQPGEPRLLQKSDEILLGRLNLQVFF